MGVGHHHHGHGGGHDHDDPGGVHAHSDHPAAECASSPARDAERRRKERTGLTFALAISIGIFLLELVGGFLSHSLALRADAGHVFADTVGLVISLVSVTAASRPVDARRTWGYHRLEILSALANGVILGAAAAVIVREAVARFGEPTHVHLDQMLMYATFGLAANLATVGFLARMRGSLNVRGAYVHALGDAANTVAVIAAALGMRFTRWDWLDPALSIVIAVLIVWSAWKLVRDSVRVLLEGMPLGMELGVVREALAAVRGVKDVHDIHIWTITSGMFAFSCHVSVADGCTEAQRDEILTAAKTLLHDRFGIDHTTIQIEGERWEEIGLVH